MSAADLINWGLAYILVGAVIWALMYAASIVDDALGNARRLVKVLVCLGAIVGWPVLFGVFVAGYINGARGRARS